jgi:hypothetical protein
MKKVIVQRVTSKVYVKDKKKMIKLTKNNLMILDAMMNQGGHTKKYEDKNKRLRYSEHLGMLDFNHKGLERIIVSTIPGLEYEDDPDIILPDNPLDALDYEYIFHTHPPTPYPGARVKENILYEFPSINDLYHFAEHYNQGNTQGSIIIAPEGIYLLTSKKKQITIPPFESTYKNLVNQIFDIQLNAMSKYNYDFKKEPDMFYRKVAQDTSYIKKYNKLIAQYWKNDIRIMYKPRKLDANDNWYLPSIYLPVNIVEPI